MSIKQKVNIYIYLGQTEFKQILVEAFQCKECSSNITFEKKYHKSLQTKTTI